jgi:glycosyltransferase involved in cell wall biosynthesis
MSNDPRVSVCIPSFNHGPYLAAAIESVLNQIYRDFEVVIVDDGSTDGSLEIAESYAARYPSQVHVFTHPERRNLGISETVNLAYQKSRGEFWSGLPSDDMLCPDKLERQVAFLDANPKIGWVYSYARYMEETGQPIVDSDLFGKDITAEANPLQSLIRGNLIPGMTVLMRRSCTEAVGFHEPNLIYSDWEFWLRMAMHCKFAFIAQPLVMYRMHSTNTSGKVGAHENLRRGLEVLTSFRSKVQHDNHELADARTRSLLELQLAYHFFCLGDEAQASQSLRSAFDCDPTLAKDQTFFAAWLKEKIFDLQHTFENGSPETGFPRWTDENLRLLGLNSLAQRAQAAEFAKAAFENHDHDLGTSWRMALKCLSRDFGWIRDRSLRTIVLKGFLGAIVARRLKSFMHKRA